MIFIQIKNRKNKKNRWKLDFRKNKVLSLCLTKTKLQHIIKSCFDSIMWQAVSEMQLQTLAMAVTV